MLQRVTRGEGLRFIGMHEKKRQRLSSLNHKFYENSLTIDESNLFDTLKKVVKRFEIKTTVRVAGGWVRDKLLNRESKDIDVALDDMTGIQFAELVNKYLEEIGIATRRIGVIQANPEQSKHLQTASCTVMGLDIDLVNLRSEEYEETSRIPAVKFGSALEDAMRRDFTINALFYNVNNDNIEDLTGKGISDLENGIIRTPLPAATTFRDDPLRMLRAVRFATRYNFSLDSAIIEAFEDTSNVELLNSKISRERIGAELMDMLNGSNPCNALDLLAKHHICPVLFTPLINKEAYPSTRDDWVNDAKLTRKVYDNIARGHSLTANEPARSYAPELIGVAGMLWRFPLSTAIGYHNKEEPYAMVVVRDSLKLKTSLAQEVSNVVHGANEVYRLVQRFRNLPKTNDFLTPAFEDLRLDTGRLVYELKENFYLALQLAAAAHDDFQDDIEQWYGTIRDHWKLSNVWETTCGFDGKTLMKILGIERNGPYIGVLLNVQRDWIILNAAHASIDDKDLVKKLMSVKDDIIEEQIRIANNRKEGIRQQKLKQKQAKAERHQAHIRAIQEERHRAETANDA